MGACGQQSKGNEVILILDGTWRKRAGRLCVKWKLDVGTLIQDIPEK